MVIFVSFASCKQQVDLPLFLDGLWEYEHDELYEKWTVKKDKTMVGYSYKFFSGNKVITENFKIKESKNGVVYYATVKNQNNGQAIPFTLTDHTENHVVFENPQHDFPKYISYRAITEDQVEVIIKGGDKNYNFKLNRKKS